MQSHINFLILIILAGLTSVGFAQKAVTPSEESVSAGAAEESVPSFPYVAQITADKVNIRSGPGTNYYSCGNLNKPDRVKVVGSQFSWSRIVPPAGSFSWISKQYVSIDLNDPSIGIVTGDSVRVYAGSNRLKPIHSTTMQLKLKKDDEVLLLGEEEGGYYKISPPAGVYLWVSTKYTESLGAVGEVPLIVELPSRPKADTLAVAPVRAPTDAAVEAGALREYYALEKQVKAERAKPMGQQNYANIKKELAKIAGNKKTGKAARYAEFMLKQIQGFELALEVAKEVSLQDAQLQRIQERIEKARATKLAQFPDIGRFAVIGHLQTSNIYGPEAEPRHYRIMDDSGKTICYALPDKSASQTDLSKLLGRKVGLVGTIKPHMQTAGALVQFTEIVELK